MDLFLVNRSRAGVGYCSGAYHDQPEEEAAAIIEEDAEDMSNLVIPGGVCHNWVAVDVPTVIHRSADGRSTASAALNHEFFTTEPYACEPSSLPKYPPSKELDVKMRDEEARRQKALNGKANADGGKRVRARERGRAMPAPEANAEIQTNLDRWRVVTHANGKSKSEKFPPPHQDGAVGYPQDASSKGPVSFGAPDTSFSSGIFNMKSSGSSRNHEGTGLHKGTKTKKEESQMASSWKFMRPFKPSTIGLSMDLLFRSK